MPNDAQPTSDSNPQESYAHSYDSSTYRGMIDSRRANVEAEFFLSHLKSGMSLLDCGCGSGTITLGLAEIVAPGNVLGFDFSQGEIEVANQKASEQSLTNVKFEVQDIYNLPYPDDNFDAIFSHFVLQHLNEPVKALQEMHRVLKPGGVIGLRNTIHDGLVVSGKNDDMYKEAHRIFLEDWKSVSGDPSVGKRLRSLMHEAGFVKTEGSASIHVPTRSISSETSQGSAEFFISLMDERWRERVIKSGLADSAKIESLVSGLKEWGDDPGAYLFIPCGEAVGWKES